ncbi:MAG: hypothetical protein ACKV0T_27990 [Planctomycetales bacterium]
MNYFTHGVRFVDRPYFLVGTALPDWLSAIDRPVRLRSRTVAPFADGSLNPASELAAGILQHLSDDAWFHLTPAFFEVTGELTRMFRGVLGNDDDHRPALLGHIVMEMLLDGVLIAREPALLDAYYAAFALVDPQFVEQTVNRMASCPTSRLALSFPGFRQERFLADYHDPPRMLMRLNQIMRRVKLGPLPPEVETVLRPAWTIVEARAAELLPGDANHPAPRRNSD